MRRAGGLNRDYERVEILGVHVRNHPVGRGGMGIGGATATD